MFGFCNGASDLTCLLPTTPAGGGPPTGWPLAYPYIGVRSLETVKYPDACTDYRDDFYA